MYIPKDRKGKYRTRVILRSKREENEIRQDLSSMFLTRISTRTLSIISNRLIDRNISPTEVSNANKELIDALEKWKTHDLSKQKIKYIFLHGVNHNVLAKLSKKSKKAVADNMRSIFYTSTKKKAMEFFGVLKD